MEAYECISESRKAQYKYLQSLKKKGYDDVEVVFVFDERFGKYRFSISAYSEKCSKEFQKKYDWGYSDNVIFQVFGNAGYFNSASIEKVLNQISFETELVEIMLGLKISYTIGEHGERLNMGDFTKNMRKIYEQRQEEAYNKIKDIESDIRKDFARISRVLFRCFASLANQIKKAGVQGSIKSLAGLNNSSKQEYREICKLTKTIANYTTELGELHKSIDTAFDSIPIQFADYNLTGFLYEWNNYRRRHY